MCVLNSSENVVMNGLLTVFYEAGRTNSGG